MLAAVDLPAVVDPDHHEADHRVVRLVAGLPETGHKEADRLRVVDRKAVARRVALDKVDLHRAGPHEADLRKVAPELVLNLPT